MYVCLQVLLYLRCEYVAALDTSPSWDDIRCSFRLSRAYPACGQNLFFVVVQMCCTIVVPVFDTVVMCRSRRRWARHDLWSLFTVVHFCVRVPRCLGVRDPKHSEATEAAPMFASRTQNIDVAQSPQDKVIVNLWVVESRKTINRWHALPVASQRRPVRLSYLFGLPTTTLPRCSGAAVLSGRLFSASLPNCSPSSTSIV